MTNLTDEQQQAYLLKVMGELADNTKNNLRVGQICFNILMEMHPELAKSIVGTDADPFYVDSNLENFYSVITGT